MLFFYYNINYKTMKKITRALLVMPENEPDFILTFSKDQLLDFLQKYGFFSEKYPVRIFNSKMVF